MELVLAWVGESVWAPAWETGLVSDLVRGLPRCDPIPSHRGHPEPLHCNSRWSFHGPRVGAEFRAELLYYVAVGRGIGTEIHTADDSSGLSRRKTRPNEKEYKKTDSALHR